MPRPIRPFTRYVRAIVDTTIDVLELVRATLDERIEKERLAEARAAAARMSAPAGNREYFGYQAAYGVKQGTELKIVKPDTPAVVTQSEDKPAS